MNVIFFSPHFPDNYRNFSIALKKKGANVLGIGDLPYDQLHQDLKDSFAEYFRVSDMEDYDKILRAVGHLTHKHGKIDRIDSLNEYWLETEAKIRTDFNIPGVKLGQIEAMKFKSMMKKKFMKASVGYAKGELLDDLRCAKKFVDKVSYPIVIKPDNGVGASDTHKINSEEQLELFFESKKNIPYIMEEFIVGDIYSFDGLVDQDGKAVFYTSHKYKAGIMETVNNDDHVHYYSLREIPEELKKAGLAVLKVFDLRERFFHLEFFDTENGWVALEVNMRPPGGLTLDMFNYANDLNMYEEWANIITKNKFVADYSRPYHCCYVGQKFNRGYKNSREQILKQFGDAVVTHTDISGVFSPALGNYGYLVRSEEEEKIRDMIEYIQQPTL